MEEELAVLDKRFYLVKSLACKDDVVEFDEDGKEGTATGKFSKLRCYSLSYGIEKQIIYFYNFWVAHPELHEGILNNYTIQNPYIKFTIRDFLSPVSIIRPYPTKPISIIFYITQLIPFMIDEYIERFTFEDADITDFVFLALLNKKREWKTSCSICLTEHITGTTCSCGHSEVVVFRPCGHAMCGRPCFIEFMRNHYIPMKTKTFNSGGTVFRVSNAVSYNADLSEMDIRCPLCNTKIERTFEAEGVYGNVPEELIHKYRDQILNKIK